MRFQRQIVSSRSSRHRESNHDTKCMNAAFKHSLVAVEMLEQFEAAVALELILSQDEFRSRSRLASAKKRGNTK